MSDLPPFDRTIALACAMRTLRGRWLHVQCACGWRSPMPIKGMLVDRSVRPDQTLADVLVYVRCGGRCGSRGRLRLHLCESVWGTMPADQRLLGTGREPGWAILLHDGLGESEAAE